VVGKGTPFWGIGLVRYRNLVFLADFIALRRMIERRTSTKMRPSRTPVREIHDAYSGKFGGVNLKKEFCSK
jgi:hypothetical protein